jgi:hypothetical protein
MKVSSDTEFVQDSLECTVAVTLVVGETWEYQSFAILCVLTPFVEMGIQVVIDIKNSATTAFG